MKTFFAVLALASGVAFGLVDWSRPAVTLEAVKAVNDDASLPWEADPNSPFLNMTLMQAKRLMGTKLGPEATKLHQSLPVWSGPETVKDIPTEFDVVKAWPECKAVTGFIRDQANCGSCWAVSSASGINDRICISSKGSFQTLLSTQHITSCCRGMSDGCDGGFPSEAWQFGVSPGVVTGGPYESAPSSTGGCYPYALPRCAHHVAPPPGMQNCTGDASTPQCASSCTNSDYSTPFSQDYHKISSVYSLPSVTQMQQSIMEKGTITVAFTVYENFLGYKSGVYTQASGSVLGGHAVDIVGWGVENNVPYWTVRNSWNENWGMNGYIRFLRGHNLCGIESQAVSGDV